MAVDPSQQGRPARESVGTPGIARDVWAHFGGPVTGQIAIGDGNILIDRSPGAYVQVTSTPPSRPRLRPSPVRWPPRDFPQLIGREYELGRASGALTASETVEFYAGNGWGKSVLLRHLSHRLPGELVANGVLFVDARGLSQDDLLQLLFDALYETDVPFKPNTGQLRGFLADVHVVLTFDDLGLDRDQLIALANTFPGSPLLVASETRTLWGEGVAIRLEGLEDNSALALLEREIGRQLAANERQQAIGLCRRLAGQPQAILHAAALVRQDRDSRVQLAPPLENIKNHDDIALRLVSSLQPAERAVLGILASQLGSAFTPDHVEQVGHLDSVDEILNSLASMGLSELTQKGWRFTGSLSPALASQLSTDSWAAVVVDHIADWIEEQRGNPTRIALEGQLVVRVAESAHHSSAWRQLWRIVRGASSAFLLSGLWDSWAVLLQQGLQAAHQLQDRAAQAWCLHQLGTRALCLGNVDLASDLLRKALVIRKSLREIEGTAVTRHNLELIAGPPPPWWTQAKVLLGGLAVLLSVVGAGFAVGHAAGVAPRLGSRPGSEPTSVAGFAPNLEPGSIDFGRVAVADQATRQVIVSNPGDSQITLRAISVGGDFQQVNRCPPALSAHETCTVDVTFRPSAAHSSRTNLTVDYDSGGQRTVPLAGTGVAPHLALDPAAIEFKSQRVGRTSAPTVVHVRNPEAVPIRITRITTDGDFGLTGACTYGPLQLSPGQTCDLAVTFSPTTRGTRQGRLQVEGDAVSASVGLSGFGGIAELKFDPAKLGMGDQSVGLPSATGSVALSNAGDAPFVVARLVGTNEFSATGCEQVLEPNASCRINVIFVPRQGGPRSATVQVIDDAGAIGSQVAVFGTGLVPDMTITQGSFHNGTVSTVTVTNNGPGQLLIQSVSRLKAPFSIISDGCSAAVLPPQGSCTVKIGFTPPSSSTSTYTAALELADNGTLNGRSSPHSFPLSCYFISGGCDQP